MFPDVVDDYCRKEIKVKFIPTVSTVVSYVCWSWNKFITLSPPTILLLRIIIQHR